MANKETVKLSTYSSEFGEIRAFVQGEDIFFLAEDACSCLQLENVSRATVGLDSDEKSSFPVESEKDGKIRDRQFVTECGLYNLIFKSRTESANGFRRWVTHDVLPEIRRSGVFASEKTLVKLSKENDFLRKELIDALDKYQDALNKSNREILKESETTNEDPYLDHQFVYDIHGSLISMREYAEANQNKDWHNA